MSAPSVVVRISDAEVFDLYSVLFLYNLRRRYPRQNSVMLQILMGRVSWQVNVGEIVGMAVAARMLEQSRGMGFSLLALGVPVTHGLN